MDFVSGGDHIFVLVGYNFRIDNCRRCTDEARSWIGITQTRFKDHSFVDLIINLRILG